MCGIIGYLGEKQALPIILEGLKRMEYRGYDSAGVATVDNGSINFQKKAGKLNALTSVLNPDNFKGQVGIGHIRWATHGAPTDANAHPHTDCKEEIFVVHNGIVENNKQIKEFLEKNNHTIQSETDTELIAHLIEHYLRDVPLEDAVKKALGKISGTYGLAVLSKKEPAKIVAARLGSPIVLGVLSPGNYIVASDVSAMIAHTKEVIYLEDRDFVVITPQGNTIGNLGTSQAVSREKEVVDWDIEEASKAGFPHYMLKEIFEQPESIRASMRGRTIHEEGLVKLGGLENATKELAELRRLVITACGTAYHAGLVGEYLMEELVEIPVEVELASELRYRSAPMKQDTALLAISQSGETADTLAAIKEAKRKGLTTLGVVNTVGSSIARETRAGVYNHAGPEIAVASTKAFTSQLTVLVLISLYLGRQRFLSLSEGQRIISSLEKIPAKIEKILESHEKIEQLASKYKQAKNFLFLGRKYNYPIAMEGALKLKEISYVHAEGGAAGEIKHGPIALVDKDTPTIIIAPKDSTHEKTLSNLQEVKARGGPIIAIASEGDEEVEKLADDVIYIPKTLEPLYPLLTVVPLQLFAYYFALQLGQDVDKPRNLAKSVTVE